MQGLGSTPDQGPVSEVADANSEHPIPNPEDPDPNSEYADVSSEDPLSPTAAVYMQPPRFSTVRVNLLLSDVKTQLEELERYLEKRGARECRVRRHRQLPELLVVRSGGRRALQETGRRVVVDARCGAAVLRGADVYAPGLLACPADARAGEAVSVFADLEGGCLRGRTLPYEGRQMHVGNGVLEISRHQLFTGPEIRGVAVRLTSALYGAPSLGPFCGGAAFLQNLPSVVAARALAPSAGELVLDLCAAPGGKTTHLAQLMQNQGLIVAVDKTASKVGRIASLAAEQGISIIRAVRADGRRLISAESRCQLRRRHLQRLPCPEHGAERPCTPPFRPDTFDRALVDAPCSGLGQRPRLTAPPPPPQLASYPPLQGRLLETAVRALRAGGVLLYSTCSLPTEENERQVAALLRRCPQLRLTPAEPRVGGPGLADCGLTDAQCAMVQRFTPRPERDTCDADTIGFFLARMVKDEHCQP